MNKNFIKNIIYIYNKMILEKDIESNLNIMSFIKNNQITNRQKIKKAFNKFSTDNEIKNSNIIKKIINLIIKFNYKNELKIDLLIMLGLKKINLNLIELNENQLINKVLKENKNNSELILSNIMDNLLPSIRDTITDKHKDMIIDNINKNIEKFSQFYRFLNDDNNEKDKKDYIIEIDGTTNNYSLSKEQYDEFIEKLKNGDFFSEIEMIQQLEQYKDENPELRNLIIENDKLEKELDELKKQKNPPIVRQLSDILSEVMNKYLNSEKEKNTEQQKQLKSLLNTKLNEIQQTQKVEYKTQPNFNYTDPVRIEAEQEELEEDSSEKSSNTGIILGIVVIVLFVIGAISYLIYSEYFEDQNKEIKSKNIVKAPVQIKNDISENIFDRN